MFIRAVPATVADCEINQAAWNDAVAIAGGGEVWDEAGLRWSWQAHNRHLMLNFPRAIDAAAAHHGVTAARERGACIVGAWLAGDVDASGLEAAGFERGWEPWWMTAPLESVADPDDDRVVITTEVPEYGPEGQRLLSLVDAPGARAWHAVARVDGHFAGRSWAFAPREIAGIYDMDVWPGFQRQGLGRATAANGVRHSVHRWSARSGHSTQHRTVSGCTQLRASSGSARASPIGTILADSPGVAPTPSSSPTRVWRGVAALAVRQVDGSQIVSVAAAATAPAVWRVGRPARRATDDEAGRLGAGAETALDISNQQRRQGELRGRRCGR